MALEVSKVYEAVRQEGLNFGLPSVHVKLGPGGEYSTEELIKEVLQHTRCRWICFLGESTTQVGMGTLVKGLSTVGLYIEIETAGEVRDPGWLHTVDRWVVDFVPGGAFNYGALRTSDMIRFTILTTSDLAKAGEYFEKLKVFSGTKYLKIPVQGHGQHLGLLDESFALARKYERSRIYVC